MRAIALALTLLSGLASAQAAGVCKAGSKCSVRTLAVTATSGTGAVCIAPPGAGTAWSTLATGTAMSVYTGTTCAAPTSERHGYSTSGLGLYSTATVTAVTGLQTGSSGTGTAYASFEAAAAGNAGRQRYDATNSVWRASNASDWLPQSRLQFSGLCTSTAAGGECLDAQSFGVGRAEVGKNYAGAVTCGWHVAGTAGGIDKVVIRAVSTVDGSSDCRCDLGACDGTGSPITCSCNKFFPAGPVVLQNLQVTLDGGIYGECATHPGQIYCTVD